MNPEEKVFYSPQQPGQVKKDNYFLHLLLFVITLISTTIAGAELTGPNPFHHLDLSSYRYILQGLPFSLCFLTFLTFHEFGHYFTSVYHRVKCSLPYYIPFFIPSAIFNIGSMGAVIRMRQVPPTTKKFFDIGIAGPLAGFAVSLVLLIYGFFFLPDPEYLFSIHPEYLEQFGRIPSNAEILARSEGIIAIEVGSSLIFEFFRQFADPSRMPPSLEIAHYPFLFVGYITLFFTALNLLPIGQLDGGHVIYGMFGSRAAGIVSRITVIVLVLYGGLGLIRPEDPMVYIYLGFYLLFLYYMMTNVFGRERSITAFIVCILIIGVQLLIGLFWKDLTPSLVWLLYALLAIRVIKIDHPPAAIEEKLDRKRFVLGIIAIIIFILCFTPNPIDIRMPEAVQMENTVPA